MEPVDEGRGGDVKEAPVIAACSNTRCIEVDAVAFYGMHLSENTTVYERVYKRVRDTILPLDEFNFDVESNAVKPAVKPRLI